jgi:transcriptional regulator with XRE-family HTH domain
MTPQRQVRPPKTIFDSRYITLISMLRKRRLELGLAQEEVALKLGLSRTFVVRTEQRERRLDVLELHRWLGVLGMKMVDVEVVLTGEGH